MSSYLLPSSGRLWTSSSVQRLLRVAMCIARLSSVGRPLACAEDTHVNGGGRHRLIPMRSVAPQQQATLGGRAESRRHITVCHMTMPAPSAPQVLVQKIRLRVEVLEPRSMQQQIVNLIRDDDQLARNALLSERGHELNALA